MGQSERVLQYMKDHGGITSFEAFQDLGITRLSARIFDLRRRGNIITTAKMESTNRFGDTVRFARYILRREANEA